MNKVLPYKAYGSIGHISSSYVAHGDHYISAGQARIATRMPRDKHDDIIVQEKLDGSCVSVAKVNGQLHCLTKKGNLCIASPYEQHHLFANWVLERFDSFYSIIEEGERIVGEWLAQAHSTVYKPFPGWEPFVAFDLMTYHVRVPFDKFYERINGAFRTPPLLSRGPACTVVRAQLLTNGGQSLYGGEEAEGFVWRVERKGKVDFLCKWVHPGYRPGKLLPELNPEVKETVWNWRP